MKLNNLRMHWKIALLSFGLILFSLLIGGIIILGSMTKLKEEALGQQLLITARTVANLPAISENITSSEGWKSIDPVAEKIRVINDATYIVVLNMNRIRLSHPAREQIGLVFADADSEPAFAEHTYISKAKGEIGTAIRAFVPVMNEEHRQIGVVVAGHLLPSLYDMITEQRNAIIVTSLLSLLFGIFGSWQLAKHIKRQMFNLEPHEISRILRERTAAFESMHEGVVAIDNEENITIFNEKAKQIFDIAEDVTGRPIRQVLPDFNLPATLQLPQPVFNEERQFGTAVIWNNRIPIRVNGQSVGALAIFQDRTEVAKIAEELTGVRAFIEALRVQNHEYMNKLHTIAGLLQLGQHEQALDYLFQVVEKQEELTSFLRSRIFDDGISGLLLSKIGRGKELGIDVKLDRHSQLKRFPPYLDRHDFVVILGNLIENAYDALHSMHRESKEIYISIEQTDDLLSLMVEDNGCGMDEATQIRMFKHGFTTKEGVGRGIGLSLVARIVAKGGGELKCHSSPDAGTIFTVTFPMKREAG